MIFLLKNWKDLVAKLCEQVADRCLLAMDHRFNPDMVEGLTTSIRLVVFLMTIMVLGRIFLFII